MRLSLLSLCALSLCVIALVLGAAVVPASAQLDDPTSGDNVTQTIEVDIDSGGDAEFRVVTTLEAESDEQEQAFESVATAFEQGQFEEQSLWTVALAVFEDIDEETERSMQLEGPRRVATLNEEDGTGELVESFEWSRFANESNNRLEVGDAWTRDGSLWFGRLDADQSLELRAPDGYDIEDAQPDSFRDRALVWEGPRTFQPGDLSATYTQDGTDTFGSLTPVIAVGVVVIAVLSGFLYMRRSDSSPVEQITGSAGQKEADGSTADEAGSESEAETPSGSPNETVPGESAAADASDEQDEIDLELLSDEERVERLLRENGGRMKQANIVKETGWSNAKVSQLLSEMNEEGRVDKLRLGRENLIALPEEDVTEIE